MAFTKTIAGVFCLKLLLLLFPASTLAQETWPITGIRDERPGIYGFTNARIVTAPGEVIENGMLLIKGKRIVAVGEYINFPNGTVLRDLHGKTIYPGFIDPWSSYGQPEPEQRKRGRHRGPQLESARKEAYGWNDALNPNYEAAESFTIDKKRAAEYRQMGFGLAMSHRPDGIARGTGAMVAFINEPVNEAVVKADASAVYSFDKGSSSQDYPSSLMGAIALLRQTYLDGIWYAQGGSDYNISMEHWNQIQDVPQVFTVDNKLSLLRADQLGDEFGRQYIIKGSGDEYQRLQEVKATGAPLIIPVTFPDAYDVEDPIDALEVNLEQLKHWELAPKNAAFLAEAGIPFAFTTDGVKKPEQFLANVRKAVQMGLTKEEALRALTVRPAAYFGLADEVGTLKPGKMANFIIVSGDAFEEEVTIYQNWVLGRGYTLNPDRPQLAGTYQLQLDGKVYDLEITGGDKPKAKITGQTGEGLEAKLNATEEHFTLTLDDTSSADFYRLSGKVSEVEQSKAAALAGRGQDEAGEWLTWTATRTGGQDEPGKEQEAVAATGEIWYPLRAYGWQELPEQAPYIIRNATVWTLEDQGTIEEADVAIAGGKIIAVGADLETDDLPRQQTNWIEVDGTGMHLTPGIVDEHSHIAIEGGVNEGTHPVTSEVRIGDVIRSNDVNIYRQLAGGVTTSHLLHGSANPIGGQTELIKLRWGLTPEQMKFEGADQFIKFALGENVKQANWGDRHVHRYPQTRMGVEQIMMDAFLQAREYEETWEKWNNLNKREKREATIPRRVLQLEALLEILNSERFITCHSYVQSEINMLMHLADSLGFTVNTFTHVLEGYKLAPEMAEHGASASTFADWWAYKYEVIDAIPYNAPLLFYNDVLTAINSDDAEMGRRLNQEAGKIVKYGRVPEEEALKMVTLNPAKILHVDDRVGSIKVGKDADLVLWTAHPLTIGARAAKTFIDGTLYYDLDDHQERMLAIEAERNRLIAKMLEAKQNGADVQEPQRPHEHEWHCDDVHFEDYE